MRRALGTLAWVGVLMAGGCLEANRPLATDTAAPGDTGDTADTQPADVDVTGCTGDLDCDDDNACTHDWCDVTAGECQHTWPVAEAISECDSAAQCDDGNPCTIDRCEVVTECGVTVGGCVHEPLTGCGGCDHDEDCDDDSLCTDDSCGDDRLCHYAQRRGCLPPCNPDGVTPIAEVLASASAGAFVKIGGYAGIGDAATCQDDRTCTCLGPLVLDDGAGRIALASSAANSDEATWHCRTTGCGVPTERCAPLQSDVPYYAWGRVEDGTWGRGGDGADPRRATPERLLVATGYCLQMEPDALAGSYSGTVIRNGQPPRQVAMNLYDNDGDGWEVEIGLDCPLCLGDLTGVWSDKVQVDDWRLAFEIDLQFGPVELSTTTFELFPNGDGLKGSYVREGRALDDGIHDADGIADFYKVPAPLEGSR